MSFRIRWPFKIMGILILLAAGAATAAVYSGYFLLKKVTIEPERYNSALPSLNLQPGQNLLLSPVSDAADYLLGLRSITQVHIGYDLPDGLNIRVNDVVPVAVTIGVDRGSIYGIDRRCRLIPYAAAQAGLELPIITGLSCPPLYETINEPRLGIVIAQLENLKNDHPDFYEIISSIDLCSGDSIAINMDGMPFHLVMYAGDLYRNIGLLKKFMLEYNLDLREIRKLDFRTEGQIVALKKDDGKKDNNRPRHRNDKNPRSHR